MQQSTGLASPSVGSGKPELSLKRSFLLFAKYSGLFALARILTAKKTRVLAYHGIWLGEGHFGNFLYMSADKFAERMALLEKWNYPIVPFTGLPNKSNHKCPTAITIDDGWYSTWKEMLPVLENHHYPATIYLTSYYCLNQVPVIDVALSYCFSLVDPGKGLILRLPAYDIGPLTIDSDEAKQAALASVQAACAFLEDDKDKQQLLQQVCDVIGIDHDELMAERWFHLMNPAEVKDAVSRGITFEAHTHHHRITHHGQESLAEEVAINSECIHELTGRVPEHFCYPSGRYTESLWPVLERCHMVSATTTDIGLVDEQTPRYAMPRILDGQDVSELEFEAEMSGFMALLRAARRS